MIWPHEVVYTVAGTAAVYDISMPLFVHGYLIMMQGEEAVRAQMTSHLKYMTSQDPRTRLTKQFSAVLMQTHSLIHIVISLPVIQ